jgi:hypothetical protein
MKIIPDPNATADSTASMSPQVISSCALPALITVAKNPPSAIMTPASCARLSFSCSATLARKSMTIVSSGPASNPSFDAPTFLTESYQANTPIARSTDPDSRYFHCLKTAKACFFFSEPRVIRSNATPASGMLFAAMIRGSSCSWLVNISITIDSIDRIAA